MLEIFTPKKFIPEHEDVIGKSQEICAVMSRKGYSLTLRQIYYQFIGKDLFPDSWFVALPDGSLTKNHNRNYKKLGTVLSAARRAGRLDWDSFGDRTRSFHGRGRDTSIKEFLAKQKWYYQIDYWVGQPEVVEAWVEKDALIDVLQTACRGYDVTTFSTRGYPSDSALYEAATTIKDRYYDHGQTTKVLHFADHDPSGVDMSRAIEDTLNLFGVTPDILTVERCALNINQTAGLPPSPAKVTDTRTAGYVERFQTEDAWELDAIEADTLGSWVTGHVLSSIQDMDVFDARKKLEDTHRDAIQKMGEEYQG